MPVTSEQQSIWVRTLDVARRNTRACLIYIGLMMAIGLAQDFISNSGGLAVAQALAAAMLAIPAHLSVLRGEQQPQPYSGAADNRMLWRFSWRAFLLGAIAFIPAIAAMIMALSMDASAEVTIASMLGVLAVVSTIVFAWWGTLLPATVLDGDSSFKAAGRRGSQTFGYAAGRLFLCFVVLGAVIVGIVALFANLSAGDGSFFFNGRPDIAMIAGTLIANAVGAFQVVMTAVILSRAYLIAEPTTAPTYETASHAST
jgi:hypothetical protein